jgi:hypothetical protein
LKSVTQQEEQSLGYSEAIHAMAYGKALSTGYLQQTILLTLSSKDITLSLLPLQD